MSMLWSKNLDMASDSGNLPIGLSAPVIFDGVVYAGDQAGVMRAYELENGREIWRVDDQADFHSKPVVYNQKLIYGTSKGRLFARNLKRGTELFYSIDLGSAIESNLTIYKDKLLVQLRNHQVFCLDAETGKTIWAFKKSVSFLTTIQKASQPIVRDNKVYVGFADGTLSVLSLEEGLLQSETKISYASKFVDVDMEPVLIEKNLIVAPYYGPVHLLSADSLKIIKKAEFSSLRAPVLSNHSIKNKQNTQVESLFFGTTDGELIETDKNLNLISRKPITNGPITEMIHIQNRIILANNKGDIFTYNLNSNMVDKVFSMGHSYSNIFNKMSVEDQSFALISSRNRLYVFKVDPTL